MRLDAEIEEDTIELAEVKVGRVLKSKLSMKDLDSRRDYFSQVIPTELGDFYLGPSQLRSGPQYWTNNFGDTWIGLDPIDNRVSTIKYCEPQLEEFGISEYRDLARKLEVDLSDLVRIFPPNK